MDKRYFSNKLVKWYEQNHRELPWRNTRDPYKIWLSEVILQQTRVIQGLPYYQRFVEAFPNVKKLAAAPEQDVLRLWQGLGYYTRARNLHKCAKVVSQQLNGEFPKHYEGLRQLPGVGDYTAAAIASIAYGLPVAVVDGNVFRVLSRVFGIETVTNTPDGKKKFTNLANSLINTDHPDIHNQAMMEFGAMHCTQKNPLCDSCIFQSSCFAYAKNLQEKLPVKKKLKGSRKRYFYYLVFQKAKSLLMKKRVEKDIWHGLYDFMLVEKTRSTSIEKILVENKVEQNPKMIITDYYKHNLTHQTILSKFILIKSPGRFKPEKGHKFFSLQKIAELPKPVLISRFLSDHRLL